MNEQPAFHIYKSSAGSGKTYQLAREYLTLGLKDPSDFPAILGVTFTNKATAEMKQRIVSLLRAISVGEDGYLLQSISTDLGIAQSETQKRAGELLKNILHQYGRFAITTIDSFFHQVIRSFAREMGLQGSFTIELDSEGVIEKVIDELLSRLGDPGYGRTRKWLIDFAQYKVDEGQSWDFKGDVASLAVEILKDDYKPFAAEILKISENPAYYDLLQKELNEIRFKFELQVKKLAVRGRILVDQHGGVDTFKYKKSGPAAQFERAERLDFDLKKRALDGLTGSDQWLSGEAAKNADLINVVEQKLIPVSSDLITYIQANQEEYFSARAVYQYFFTFGILAELTRMLQQYREENDVMLIADLPDFLRQIIRESDTPYIYEKVGSRFKHYLIDEFQDTSLFQWSNFKPLVKNATDAGQRCIAVGDIKQSIYRWRGGDFDLLQNVIEKDIGAYNSETTVLDKNWRSSVDIVKFNNSLFADLPEISQVYFRGLRADFSNMMEESLSIYADVKQEPVNTGTAGHVDIQFIEDKTEWKEEALRKTIRKVEELQREGFALRDIAILARGRREGAQIADAFLTYKTEVDPASDLRYEVVSSEALYLNNSYVVRFITNLLRWIAAPKDKIALVEWMYELEMHVSDRGYTAEDVFGKSDQWELIVPPEFIEELPRLPALPVYEIVGSIVRIFKLDLQQDEFVYLQGFQDAILDYTKNERGDLSSFLEWWETSGSKRTVQLSDTNNAIKILTVHKSKGLEFPVVIIPFLSWSLDTSAGSEKILWCPPADAPPFDRMPVIPLKYGTHLEKTYWANFYWQEKMQNYLDSVNLLYVAFTRPVRILTAFAHLPAKPNDPKNIGDLIFNSLKDSEYYHTDDNRLLINDIPSIEHNIAASTEYSLQRYPTFPWRDKVSLQMKGSKELENSRFQSKYEGIRIHEDLSRIATIGDLEGLSDNHADRLLKSFILSDKVRAFFENVDEVKLEVPVLLPGGNVRRIDRLIRQGKEWTVIDFKTGTPRASHKKQVVEYVNMVKNMGFERVRGVLIYSDPITVEHV